MTEGIQCLSVCALMIGVLSFTLLFVMSIFILGCCESLSSDFVRSWAPFDTLVGCVQCIGATTLDEYRKHIEKDPALERRFQPVLVPEPTVDETIEILKGLRERYEIHHKLRYTDEALVAAAQLSYQYIRFVWMICLFGQGVDDGG